MNTIQVIKIFSQGDEKLEVVEVIVNLYNNQINVRAVIGQSAVGYCAAKPTEESHVLWIIIDHKFMWFTS